VTGINGFTWSVSLEFSGLSTTAIYSISASNPKVSSSVVPFWEVNRRKFPVSQISRLWFFAP
jgi:hypothetical protein